MFILLKGPLPLVRTSLDSVLHSMLWNTVTQKVIIEQRNKITQHIWLGLP